ncbi:2Fe-2S iron-sulfur cluster binding domain-containing protein [Halobacteriovorax sp.]|uniref:2Fe-2S iron-sulfur cluster binding domain-containing protein n=1 Tax=Halobacteriovorax sp. TaxID=2020862 RepID=UPI003561E803
MPTVSLVQVAENGELLEEDVLYFEVQEGENIWIGLETAGYILPKGCLAGSCGTCRINILEGSENLSKQSIIENDTVEHIKGSYTESHGEEWVASKDIRLSCRSKVLGDVKIHILKK